MLKKFEELEAKYDDICIGNGETCNGCRYDVDGMNCGMMFAYEQGRAEVLDEVMKKAEEMQLEQIENLDKSIRRNGKMWAGYMITYLGHIQAACKRMLEDK